MSDQLWARLATGGQKYLRNVALDGMRREPKLRGDLVIRFSLGNRPEKPGEVRAQPQEPFETVNRHKRPPVRR